NDMPAGRAPICRASPMRPRASPRPSPAQETDHAMAILERPLAHGRKRLGRLGQLRPDPRIAPAGAPATAPRRTLGAATSAALAQGDVGGGIARDGTTHRIPAQPRKPVMKTRHKRLVLILGGLSLLGAAVMLV